MIRVLNYEAKSLSLLNSDEKKKQVWSCVDLIFVIKFVSLPRSCY